MKSVDSRATTWLLEKGQPSVRHATLTEVLGRPAKDPEVVAARKEIAKTGWAKDILDTLERAVDATKSVMDLLHSVAVKNG